MRSDNCIVLVLIVTVVGLLVLSVWSAAVEWQQYTMADGLNNDDVLSLYESADGSIWIGCHWDNYTHGLGLNQYIAGEVLTWDKGDDFWPAHVYGICEDALGTIWCNSSMMHGCGFLEGGIWHTGFVDVLRWRTKSGIVLGPNGRLWAGFGGGIVWHDPVTGQTAQVWESPWLAYPWQHVLPRYLFVSSDGHIWFSFYKYPDRVPCIYEIDDTGDVLRTFLWRYGTLAESPDGTIWLGRIGIGEYEPELARGIERLEGDEFVDAGPPDGYPAHGHGPIFISSNGELVCAGQCDIETGVSGIAILTFDGVNWAYYPCPFESVWIEDVLIHSRGDIWVALSGTPYHDRGVWVLKRQAPPIFIGVQVEPASVSGPTSQRVFISMHNSEARTVDLYVALEAPNGAMYFYPGFGVAYVPFLTGINIPAETHIENYELFTISLPELPSGTYRWYSAFTHAGTMNFASNIASCEWQVE